MSDVAHPHATDPLSFSRSRHRPAWAILRVDTTAAKHKGSPFTRMVTVKKVVLAEAYARSEVERLNAMNASKGCQYVAQLTELDETYLSDEEEESLGR